MTRTLQHGLSPVYPERVGLFLSYVNSEIAPPRLVGLFGDLFAEITPEKAGERSSRPKPCQFRFEFKAQLGGFILRQP